MNYPEGVEIVINLTNPMARGLGYPKQ